MDSCLWNHYFMRLVRIVNAHLMKMNLYIDFGRNLLHVGMTLLLLR